MIFISLVQPQLFPFHFYSQGPSLEVLNSEFGQVKESFFLSIGPRMWPITNS